MARLSRLLAVAALGAAVASPGAAQRPVVYRIPVTGTIELGIAPFIKRSLREAEQAGARAAILEVNTLGGRVDAALQIVDAISAAGVPVYAFVHPRAISAGALISVATDSVFMVPDALMGASTVVEGEGQVASEKAQSAMRAQYRAIAERRGLDPRVGEAMVDPDIEIPGVVEKGKLLTLTTDEAVKVGYAIEVESFEALLRTLGLADAEVRVTEVNWAEALVRFLTHPVVAAVLLPLGVLGLMMELKTPGFGFAGGFGLLALALFFGSHIIVGLAGWEDVILMIVGLALLGLEIFVIPGFGVAGILGLVCIGIAIFLALLGDLKTWHDVVRATGTFVSSALIFAAALYLIVRQLPKSERHLGILLKAATTRDAGYIAGEARGDLVGAVGTALVDLRPAGTARFGDQRLDVVSEGGFVPRGKRVRVVRAEAYRLVVLPEDEGGSA
ncbi:MAG TPA: NfeD family protein [Gemmatimonadales bacterium]|nr:NfeD family protein [Gemmatimonadales bacterium]